MPPQIYPIRAGFFTERIRERGELPGAILNAFATRRNDDSCKQRLQSASYWYIYSKWVGFVDGRMTYGAWTPLFNFQSLQLTRRTRNTPSGCIIYTRFFSSITITHTLNTALLLVDVAQWRICIFYIPSVSIIEISSDRIFYHPL